MNKNFEADVGTGVLRAEQMQHLTAHNNWHYVPSECRQVLMQPPVKASFQPELCSRVQHSGSLIKASLQFATRYVIDVSPSKHCNCEYAVDCL